MVLRGMHDSRSQQEGTLACASTSGSVDGATEAEEQSAKGSFFLSMAVAGIVPSSPSSGALVSRPPRVRNA